MFIWSVLIFNHIKSVDNVAILVNRYLFNVQMRLVIHLHACVAIILDAKKWIEFDENGKEH